MFFDAIFFLSWYLFASVVASAALELNENLTKQFISENLHFTSPHINELKNLWFSQYDHLSFVDLKFGSEAKSLNDFHQSVVESADSIRDILVSNWIPQCAEIVKTGLQNEKESLRSSKNKNGILPGSGICELTIGPIGSGLRYFLLLRVIEQTVDPCLGPEHRKLMVDGKTNMVRLGFILIFYL